MVDQPIWHIESTPELVTVRFCGNLDTVNGLASAMALAEVLRAAGREVIWDVREMTGYDTGARTAWQKHIQPLRSKIRGIRVVGATPITRFGTAALAMAIGVPATFDNPL
jgi:hypothetical protein